MSANKQRAMTVFVCKSEELYREVQQIQNVYVGCLKESSTQSQKYITSVYFSNYCKTR